MDHGVPLAGAGLDLERDKDPGRDITTIRGESNWPIPPYEFRNYRGQRSGSKVRNFILALCN